MKHAFDKAVDTLLDSGHYFNSFVLLAAFITCLTTGNLLVALLVTVVLAVLPAGVTFTREAQKIRRHH